MARQLRKPVLNSLDVEILFPQRFHRFDHRLGGRNRRDAGDTVLNCRRSYPTFVGPSPFAAWRINDQSNAVVLQMIDQIGMALGNLLDVLNGNPNVLQLPGGALRRHDVVAEIGQPSTEVANVILVTSLLRLDWPASVA